jgi:hypothetical protein
MREGTIAPTAGSPAADSENGCGVRSIALVVQRRDQVNDALGVCADLAGGGCLRLAVIGIPVQRPIVNHLAPLSGAVSFDQLSDEATEDAFCAARLAALSAPSFAETTYRCLEDWRAPCLLGALREGLFGALVLSGRPERRNDRRRLEGAAREGSARIVMVGEAQVGRRGAGTAWPVPPVAVAASGLQARVAR